MLSHCKRFTQKWLVSSTSSAWHQTTSRMVACSWSGPKWNLYACFSWMHLKSTWNYSWWKLVGRMPNVFTAKWLLHAMHLAAVSTSCSTVIGATLLTKKSRHRQSFHGVTIENFHTRWVFFKTNGICWLRIFAHHYFLPFFFHGWSSFELEERCLLRRGGGNGGSRGPSSFSGTCAFPLTLSGFFSFSSESLSETSVHLKAEPRFEPSPMVQPTGPLVPFGLACSHDISAGDTKTPAWTARARRHISMMQINCGGCKSAGTASIFSKLCTALRPNLDGHLRRKARSTKIQRFDQDSMAVPSLWLLVQTRANDWLLSALSGWVAPHRPMGSIGWMIQCNIKWTKR